MVISGSDLRVDGVLLATDEYGNLWNAPLDLPKGAVLSGVFSDGTPFAFSSTDGDSFSPGTLRVNSSRLGWVHPDLYTRYRDEPLRPTGLLPGQELTLIAGDQADANFTAGWGSKLTLDGGTVGDNFEAVGAVVDLKGGSIGDEMDVLLGSELNVTGGTVGDGLEVHRGAVVNLTGGSVGRLTVRGGGLVRISGGTFGRAPDEDGYYGGARLAMEQGSVLELFASEYHVEGYQRGGLGVPDDPIGGLLEPGSSIVLDWNEIQAKLYLESLEAVLLDGSRFRAQINSNISPINEWEHGAYTIRITNPLPVPEPSTMVLVLLGGLRLHFGADRRGRG